MLAIGGVIRGTSREKLYQEIGIESLEDRRWLRRLCLFYKITNNNTPSYLHDLVKKQIQIQIIVLGLSLSIVIPQELNGSKTLFFLIVQNNGTNLTIKYEILLPFSL